MKRILYLALCLLVIVAMTACFVACDEETNTTESTVGTNDGDNKAPVHTHTYASEYSYDATNHYYAATCEHVGEKSGTEAHSFDANGSCKCGYYKLPNITSVEQAIAIAKANNGKLVTSIVTMKQFSNYSWSSTYSAIWTEYMDNYTRVLHAGEYLNQYFYALDKNGNIFGVLVQGDSAPTKDEGATEESMNGYAFDFFFMGDYETKAYGVNGFIEALYNKAVEMAEEGATVGTVENNICTFSFDIAETATVTVSFTVNEEGIISDATIATTAFDKEYGTDYTYAVEQLTTSKTNPFDPNGILPESYTIVDANGNDITENEIIANAGDSIVLSFKDVVPATALLTFSEITYTLYDENDEEVYSCYGDMMGESIYYTIYIPGTFKLVITVDGVETEATVKTSYKTPETFSSAVYDSEYLSFQEASTATMYVGKTLAFYSYVDSYCDGSFTAELVGDVAGVASITDGKTDDGDAAKIFTATEVGTYTIKLTSVAVPELNCELTIEVIAAPDVETEILVGNYVFFNNWGEKMIELAFGEENSVSVSFSAMNNTMSGKYTYEYADGEITTTYVEGDEILNGLSVNDNYQLVATINYYDYVLEAVAAPAPIPEVFDGYVTVKDHQYNAADGVYGFVFVDGKYKFYKDGAETNAISIMPMGDSGFIFSAISYTMGGNLCANTEGDALTALTGEAYVLSPGGVLFTLTFTTEAPNPGDDGEEDVNITAEALAGNYYVYGDYDMILDFTSATEFKLEQTSGAFTLVGTFTVENNTFTFVVDEENSINADVALPLESFTTVYSDGAVVIQDQMMGDMVFNEGPSF